MTTFASLVSRTSLSLADLYIENTADPTCPYSIIREGIGPGQISNRRVTAESPFINGRILVHAVQDTGSIALGVRVRGSSSSDLSTKIGTLVTAFEQLSYTLTFAIDGVTHEWLCEVADYAVGTGGVIQDLEWRSYTQQVRFVIPRAPIPVVGTF